ncbi:hypothetical protein DF186_23885, partial [Enterococcus hirae]
MRRARHRLDDGEKLLGGSVDIVGDDVGIGQGVAAVGDDAARGEDALGRTPGELDRAHRDDARFDLRDDVREIGRLG